MSYMCVMVYVLFCWFSFSNFFYIVSSYFYIFFFLLPLMITFLAVLWKVMQHLHYFLFIWFLNHFFVQLTFFSEFKLHHLFCCHFLVYELTWVGLYLAEVRQICRSTNELVRCICHLLALLWQLSCSPRPNQNYWSFSNFVNNGCY